MSEEQQASISVRFLREQISTPSMAASQLAAEELKILLSTLDELASWKKGASELLDAIDFQAIGKELNVPLGGSIAPAILPGIQALKRKHDLALSLGGSSQQLGIMAAVIYAAGIKDISASRSSNYPSKWEALMVPSEAARAAKELLNQVRAS